MGAGTFGSEALEKYGLFVVTRTTKSTAPLQEEFESLPETNLGRQMALKVQGRVLGVDSSWLRWPPHRTRNDMLQQVDSFFEQNKHKGIDCDMMNWARIKEQMDAEFEVLTRELREEIKNERRPFEENQHRLQQAHESERAKLLQERVKLEAKLHSLEDKQKDLKNSLQR